MVMQNMCFVSTSQYVNSRDANKQLVNSENWSLYYSEMQVSGCSSLRIKRHDKEQEINTCGFWYYIKILWSEMISLCMKLNIIYIITCNP